ncbi:MAG TPA: hypothetical protein VKF15_00440 [Nitrososphaerales archaeon]|nr:hypothetical protein [Nitrososphaerales archaeon]
MACAILLVFMPGATHAATVTVNLKCQLMESAAATETLTLTGGSPTPSTALCTPAGTTTPVMVNPSSTMTVTVQGDGSSSRYRGNISWTSYTSYVIQTPASGSANVLFYNYYQLQNTFVVEAQGQPDFDSNMIWIMNGTQLGVAGSTVCTIRSTAAPTAPCSANQGWADYGTTVWFPIWASNPPSQFRWGFSSIQSPSLTVNTGGAVVSRNYYKQVEEVFSYSVSGGGSGYGTPSLSCTFLGLITYCSALTTTPLPYWLDFGSTWNVNNVLQGSGNSERWSTNGFSGTASSGATIAVLYFHQFSVSVGYFAVEGGSPPAFSISYAFYGTFTSSSPTPAPKSYWMDAGGSFTLSIPAGTPAERWRSPLSSFPIFDGASYTIQLHHQYSLQLSFAVLGGGSGYGPPSLTFSNFSKTLQVNLTPTTQFYWADVGTPWAVVSALSGANGTQRWQTNQTDAGQVSGSLGIPYEYYHQYYVVFAYGVFGGGTGYSAPSVRFTTFGAGAAGNQGWADSGSRFSFTDPLPGSSQSERWDTGDSSGVVSGPGVINTTRFYHQYAFDLSYSIVSPTAPIGNPEIDFIEFGTPDAQSLSTSTTTIWLDSASPWSVLPEFGGSSATERWGTQQAAAGFATSPTSSSFTFYNQFYIKIGYDIVGGGSPKAPAVAYVAYASPASLLLTNRSVSIWMDAGSRWTLPSLLSGSNRQERWIAQGPSSATVSAAFNYQGTYLHQFYLLTMSNSAAGGVFLNGTDWYANGADIRLNASAFPGWRFTYWSGVGSGAYNGTTASLSFPLSGPAAEVAVFYPGLSIIVSGSGKVTYSTGGLNGSVSTGHNVVYVPLSSNVTLRAFPALFDIVFEGWSEGASGTVAKTSLVVGGPVTVGASFGLDYSDIGIIGATIPCVMVLAVYVFVVRRLQARRV